MHSRRARRRAEARLAGAASAGGDVSAPLRERNPTAARAVTLGVVIYCLIAWAAIIKLAGVGWEALKPDPVSYAQSGDDRVE